MKYFSTSSRSPHVDPAAALLSGLAPDGGLYMPEALPRLSMSVLESLRNRSLPETAAEILFPFFVPSLDRDSIERIAHETFTFPAPLVQLRDNIYILELFHGPTFAFKDFGARFLARAMSVLRRSERELWILVATSGDTGSAVANGFLDIEGIRVFILYPSGKVSRLQEQQLTTLGHNITALEILGTFDDCQRFAKEAFGDPDLLRKRDLSSANSINIGRLLPQSVYYFSAFQQLEHPSRLIFSIPSGNLGNLCAGVIASRLGVPVEHFVAGTNINGTLGVYLESGEFRPRDSVSTVSNAMDVGNPSNMARLLELYDRNVEKMRAELSAPIVSDEASIRAIREVFDATGYVLDPHAAVGWAALARSKHRLAELPSVILGTAHPAKFLETVAHACPAHVEIPAALRSSMEAPKQSIILPGNFSAVKDYLLSL